MVTATVGTWTSLGFKEIDATNFAGWYQLGVPNAALASGAKEVNLLLKGATNMTPTPLKIRLVAVNPDVATNMGITSLPTTAVTTNGSLPTVGSGTSQITLSGGTVSLIPGQNPIVLTGTAQGGASGSITLAAGASATDNLYRWSLITIQSGTGAGQTRAISNYVGSTKVASVTPAWITNPDATSVYNIDGEYMPQVDTSGNITLGNYAASKDPLTLLTTDSTKFAGANIANLDAAVSSRMATFTLPTNFSVLGIDTLGRLFAVGSVTGTVTTSDSSGVTTLLGRLTSTRAGLLDNLDAAVSSRMATFSLPANFANLAITSLGQVSASGSMTVAGNVTVGDYAAGKDPLSLLTTDSVQFAGANIATITSTVTANLDTNVGSRASSSAMTTAQTGITGIQVTLASPLSDTAGTTTLLGRVTATRAGYLDNLTRLDSAVSAVSSNVWLNSVRSLTSTTGFTLTQAFPANFASMLISVAGLVSGTSGGAGGSVIVGGYASGQDPLSLLTNDSTKWNGAYLNAQLSLIKTQTDKFTFSGGNVIATLNGELVGLSNTALNAITSQIYNYVVDGTWTLQDSFKILTSVLAGISKVNGNVITFRDVADTKNRVIAVVDSTGQRITITYDRS